MISWEDPAGFAGLVVPQLEPIRTVDHSVRSQIEN